MILGYIHEEKLSSKERSDFGLPSQKKYPMPDKSHVLAAIRMFNHCDASNEKELAANIKSKMKMYGISSDRVGENNRLKKYLTEEEHSKLYKAATFPLVVGSGLIGTGVGAIGGAILGTGIGGLVGGATGTKIAQRTLYGEDKKQKEKAEKIVQTVKKNIKATNLI